MDASYDAEGMIQTGIRANTEMAAYAFATGLPFQECRLNPILGFTTNMRAAIRTPAEADDRTFNQLLVRDIIICLQDFVGRQNIND